MSILEKQSARKRKSIIYLVNNHEYSVGYALLKVEELYDMGKLTDDDYDYLGDWLEELLDEDEELVDEQVDEQVEEETPEVGEE